MSEFPVKSFLILEDGTVFEGTHIGVMKEVISEIVFNTSMASYLEVLTDPSCAGQAVCMTYPLIGNYGICKDDMESRKSWVDGLIVRELSRISSNFRSDMTIQEFLEEHEVPGIAGIDTRALTKILREKGTMNGMITTRNNYDLEEVILKLKSHTAGKMVEKVTCEQKYDIKGSRFLEENGAISGSAKFDKDSYEKGIHEKKPSIVKELNGLGIKVALLDYGAKESIKDSLVKRGCDITVYPALTTAEELIAANPDGIMLSNGPGNPKGCSFIIEELRKLYQTDIPIFGIGLGHQLMALATGADTFRMRYGHRGGNYPVRDLQTGKVYILSQNHGYAVDMEQVDEKVATPAFVNVNDGTNEGLNYTNKNIFTVQFYPGAYLGSENSGDLFDKFIHMMKERKENA